MNFRNFLTLFCFIATATCWAQQDSTIENINQPQYEEDFRITDLMKRYSENYKGKKIEGYRVQLYSGNRVKAKEMRKKALQSFPDIFTEITYAAPDFKTQMGNFRTELEAEKYLQQIRVVFPGSFVVKSKINLPELSIDSKEN